MIDSNSILFVMGAITFVVTFSWFKYAAMAVFKMEFVSEEKNQGMWSKLFKVFIIDWLLCVLGVLGTGIIFVMIFNIAH